METLEGIWNALRSFIKVSKVKKKMARYTYYARICVYMNVEGSLPHYIKVSY